MRFSVIILYTALFVSIAACSEESAPKAVSTEAKNGGSSSPPNSQSLQTAAPTEASCTELSTLSGKNVILYGKLIRLEGKVTQNEYVALVVYACVDSKGVSPIPVVLFAADSKTAKEENPKKLPADKVVWRLQGALQGSVEIDSSTEALVHGQKQQAPLLTNALIAPFTGQ